MSVSHGGNMSIPRSPDLSRPSHSGNSRTSSARPSGSQPSQCHVEFVQHADAHNTPFAENEALMSPPHGSRPARPSTLSPGPPHSITPHHSAISHQYNSYSTQQDVSQLPVLLNQRSLSHRHGLSPNLGHQVSLPTSLESSVLSSSSSRHAAINSLSARPRTSNQVFNSISDLAAHYGIPQFLPVAPRTIPRRTTDSEEASTSHSESFQSSPDFADLCSNYLNMLSQNPSENGVNDVPVEGIAPTAVATEVTDAEAIRSLMDVFNAATPDLHMSNDLNEYLTSPLIDSPLDDDLLATPALESEMHADVMTSPLIGDFVGNDSFDEFPSLFGGFDDDALHPKPSQSEQQLLSPHPPNFNGMYSLESPITPLLDTPGTSPLDRRIAPLPSPKRKSNATGTRKNITPASLVPIDAPTQSRKYLTPSATSRKELPATWRRKRQRAADPGDEEDQLVEEGLTPTLSEQEQIEAKRRQNTLAARRSRKRKLEYQRELELSLEQHKREGEVWKQRAMTCQALLRSHHIEYPDFPEP